MKFKQINMYLVRDDGSNRSLCSSLSADRDVKQIANMPASYSSSHTTKKVWFDEESNTILENTERYAGDCLETWYTSEDYSRFSADAKICIKKFQNEVNSKSFIELLSLVHEIATGVDFVLNDASSLLTPKNKLMLASLYEEEFLEFIGLERHCCAFIRKDAEERRESVQDVVYEIQAEADMGHWDNSDAEEEIRDCCQNFSQAACLYSQLIALTQLNAFKISTCW